LYLLVMASIRVCICIQSHFSIFHVVDFMLKTKIIYGMQYPCFGGSNMDPTGNRLGWHEVARQVWLPCSGIQLRRFNLNYYWSFCFFFLQNPIILPTCNVATEHHVPTLLMGQAMHGSEATWQTSCLVSAATYTSACFGS
jgi:hypothetical protein